MRVSVSGFAAGRKKPLRSIFALRSCRGRKKPLRKQKNADYNQEK